MVDAAEQSAGNDTKWQGWLRKILLARPRSNPDRNNTTYASRNGCVGKAVIPRRLGVMPRMIPKSPSSRATHYVLCCCPSPRPAVNTYNSGVHKGGFSKGGFSNKSVIIMSGAFCTCVPMLSTSWQHVMYVCVALAAAGFAHWTPPPLAPWSRPETQLSYLRRLARSSPVLTHPALESKA